MIEEEDKVDVVMGQLTGKARTWTETYESSLLEYEDFRRRFLRKFDNEDLKRDLLALLYSRQQGSEPAEAYLGEQWTLSRRIVPEEMILNTFKRNLPGSIKAIIGNQRFETAEALSLAAAHAEESLAEERRAFRQTRLPPADFVRN